MPNFNTDGDVDIDVDEFLDSCSTYELDEVKQWILKEQNSKNFIEEILNNLEEEQLEHVQVWLEKNYSNTYKFHDISFDSSYTDNTLKELIFKLVERKDNIDIKELEKLQKFLKEEGLII